MESNTIKIENENYRATSVYRALRFQQFTEDRLKKYSHQDTSKKFRTIFKRASCFDDRIKFSKKSTINAEPYNNNRTHVDFHEFRDLNQKQLYGPYNDTTTIRYHDKYSHNDCREEKMKYALSKYRKKSIKNFFGSEYDLKTGVAETPIDRKTLQRTASTILANVDQSTIVYSC